MFPIETVLDILDEVYPTHPMHRLTQCNPYKALICCLLSLRNRDTLSVPICDQLYRAADTPEKMLALPMDDLLKMIAPLQYCEQKARTLKEVSADILNRFNGKVPATVEALDTMKGVGRKTANFVVSVGYGKPAICVDTHVHRICNRLGYVRTATPDDTELELRKTLPERYWIMINRVMVRHGQEICRPLGPRCGICPVNAYCQKVDVVPAKAYANQAALKAQPIPGVAD